MVINRANIFGVMVSMTNLVETTAFFKNYNYSNKGYICFPDMSVISTANKNTLLRQILNESTLTLPDGKPIEIASHFKGYHNTKTVSGYWLLHNLLNSELSHYFYGGNEETLSKLKAYLLTNYPKANILGYAAPPILKDDEIAGNDALKNDINNIKALKANIVWVGISSPKQDILMKYFHAKLDYGIMAGVGGVFDYMAGTHKKSPEWVKKIGLRWFYRLMQNPGRFWKRYLDVVIFICLYPFNKSNLK